MTLELKARLGVLVWVKVGISISWTTGSNALKLESASGQNYSRGE